MQLGGYKVQKRIGRGGMATVYKGLQSSLQRPVALKVLNKQLLEHSDVRVRFERESLIIAKLKHPNIINVIDRGISPKGQPYFVMEYVEGTDLKEEIKKGELKFNQCIHIAFQICKGLAYAHDNGVIHRDIKPANILLDKAGHVYVLDFGIAHFCESVHGAPQQREHETQVGDVMGTVAYMAPEIQASGDNASIRSDIYAFGVLFYELLTGRLPVGRFGLSSKLNPAVPAVIDELIERCLSANMLVRPGSANEIKNTLLKIMRGAHLEPAQQERAKQAIARAEDKFSLLDVIKEDQYGAVYLFEDKIKHELLVIKKRLKNKAGYLESKLLNQLPHPNITKVLGVSKNERLFITVLEYLSGGCLKDRLLRPYEWNEFLKIADQICDALSFAHKNNIVHGNLRPGNVLFSEQGVIKISDFGLDEHYGIGQEGVNWYNHLKEEKSVQTDIYAAGALFYQMLCGCNMPPEWNGKRLLMNEEFEKLPHKVREIILKMQESEPAKRYLDFTEVMESLAKVEALSPSQEEKGIPQAHCTESRSGRLLYISIFVLCAASVSVYLAGSDSVLYENTLLLLHEAGALSASLFAKVQVFLQTFL